MLVVRVAEIVRPRLDYVCLTNVQILFQSKRLPS